MPKKKTIDRAIVSMSPEAYRRCMKMNGELDPAIMEKYLYDVRNEQRQKRKEESRYMIKNAGIVEAFNGSRTSLSMSGKRFGE